jgi:very-short-patch-repair endonuclease
MTEAEGKIWNLALRRDATWYRFLRQKLIGNYILDFYCSKLKLWIEIDGESHDRQWAYDKERTYFLQKIGIKIIRYTNNQVYYQLEWVMLDLESRIKEREQELGLCKSSTHFVDTPSFTKGGKGELI